MGARPSEAIRALRVVSVPIWVAKAVIVLNHYLHTIPGGTSLAFGILRDDRLMGAITFGVGPGNVHRLVDGCERGDCLTLTRFWLADQLPPNSESRVLGEVIRKMRRYTELKILVTYADPSRGHVGTIYQATNWEYIGLSNPTPLLDIGDGKPHHSRTLGHAFGTHSVRHFAAHGVSVKLVPQSAKHRYIFFLDPRWCTRLSVPTTPYPKIGG